MVRFLSVLIVVLSACGNAVATAAVPAPGPLADLQSSLAAVSMRLHAQSGIAVEDLSTGTISGINGNASLPAASTIKVPVMVEVFRQMSLGKADLTKKMHVMQSDKDWGSGDICDVANGSTYTVSQLLWKMITESDNTATNMLIRLVGRTNINQTMRGLGLDRTTVADYIRSDGDIRALRSSPNDMLHLLDAIAREQLIDVWSSREMLSILEGQQHNSLLPQPLPRETKVAHKTGTLHDTLNDVGIVESRREPYVIAVMTTQLPTLDLGRSFIRGVSLIAWRAMERYADWRDANGLGPVDRLFHSPANAPDLGAWAHAASPLPLDAPSADIPADPAAAPVSP